MAQSQKVPTIPQIKKYLRAVNYIGAAQIYLQDNYLLQRPLEGNDIKPRLLGHWGTVPGINFTYAYMNYLIIKHSLDMMFVLGPGHGFPAIQANLFVEGTLSKFYKNVPLTKKGLGTLIRDFSWPYGFPSHSNPGTPGAILEGGELGYALSTSFGAVLDKPNLIVSCLIGDGEAETGPTATAWHANKFLNPKKDGVVLPILHCNGYKISGPTLFGRMSNAELTHLFKGYGWEPIIVDGKDPHSAMKKACDKAYALIKSNKEKAKKGLIKGHVTWPMIVLKTPKGWTGIKTHKGQKVEGNCVSHQVVIKRPKTVDSELKQLEKWLTSYNFEELFDGKTFATDVLACVPKKGKMGQSQHSLTQISRKDLSFPKLQGLSHQISKTCRGKFHLSSMRSAGQMTRELYKLNKKNFRLFSPDETYSNKLHAVFEATSRAWQWPIKSHDIDLSPDGRVIEMLSEHTLQGMLQGYLLTGGHGLFASYEAFVQIVSSMVDQYAKFLKASEEFNWRGNVSSMNIILSSLGWRQDHNGYSHQNPGLISNVLEKHGQLISVYFPVDANSMLVTMEECYKRTDCINIIVAGKNLLPQWLTLDEARKQVKTGIATWDFASDRNPDVVFASTGDYLTQETMAAIDLLKGEFPKIKLRYVNISELTTLGIGDERYPMNSKTFHRHFSQDKPCIISFHGYTGTIKQLLFGHDCGHRFTILGYRENGSTTTPFDMQVRNGTSRYQLAILALQKISQNKNSSISKADAQKLIRKLRKKLKDHRQYIIDFGDDPEEIKAWHWGYYQGFGDKCMIEL